MAVALLTTAWVFVNYHVSGNIASRITNLFSVTVVGFYIFIFLLANMVLSTVPNGRIFLMAVPAAFLASWAIVAGPYYGWLIEAGIFMAVLVSLILVAASLAVFFVMLFVGVFIGPFITGCLTGLLAHLAARTLSDQPFWDRLARREAFAHCIGFIMGAYVVFRTADAIDRDLVVLRGEGAGPMAFVELLWPIYLGAPAIHLACLWAARYRWGWPTGDVDVRRLVALCPVLFLIMGIGRGIAFEDWAMLVTWPAREFSAIQFWKNYPQRDAPFDIGDHRILMDPGTYPQRHWNRELRQFDSFQFRVSGAAWPLADAHPGAVEIRLRAANQPYVPVKCDDPALHGLLLCRPLGPQETAAADDRSVPAFWLRDDYEIYGAPERPDIVLGRSPSRTEGRQSLLVAFSETYYPKISVLLPIHGIDLPQWEETVAGFDQIVEHHLQREGHN